MAGHSILVFCPTKNWCEKLADTVAREFYRLGCPPHPRQAKVESENEKTVRAKLQEQLDGKKLSEVIEQLKRCPAGLDPSLSRSVSFAVSYHHAGTYFYDSSWKSSLKNPIFSGLTYDERDIIEGAFKQGVLRVLIATSTLSSGVNLPARRVVVRCPFTFQNRLIDTLSYRQMIGRAGRKGIDTEGSSHSHPPLGKADLFMSFFKGESILICRENERLKVQQLVSSDLEPVSSCLIQGNGETLCSSMKRAILEVGSFDCLLIIPNKSTLKRYSQNRIE